MEAITTTTCRYVVYHPLFSELEMGEVDVKYHQFSYLANSDDEITIENVLVYQNFTGTRKCFFLNSKSHFSTFLDRNQMVS